MNFIIIEKWLENNGNIFEKDTWPLLKAKICLDDMNLKAGAEDETPKPYFLLSLAVILSVINYLRLLFRRNDSVIFGAMSRVEIYNSKVVDRMALKAGLNNEAKLHHFSSMNLKLLLTMFKHCIVAENFLVLLIAKPLSYFTKINVEKHLSQNFIQLLQSQNNDLSKNEFTKLISNFIIKKSIYKVLIGGLSPNDIYIVSAYTKFDIVAASNSLNIETIEIQHGLLAPYHELYTYDNFSESNLLPAKLIVDSKYWKERMNKVFYSSEVLLSKVESPPLSDSDYKNDIKYCMEKYQNYILFTGQRAFYTDIVSLIKDFLKDDNTMIFIYRPHPRELIINQELNKLALDNQRFLIVNNNVIGSTLALIQCSHLHMSVYSTCHFDSMELLGNSYVFDVSELNIMKLDVNENRLVYFKQFSDIKEYL